MKLEVITIPVSDVDRAKEFCGRLGWRLRRHAARCGPVHAARLGVLGPVRPEPHVGGA
jgi:catechol 2,3-dioxygenase-like lactoylglutathione lyase family enzyme